MKKIIKYICLSLSFGILLTSCDNEDYTGNSVLDYTDTSISVSSSATSYTFNEALIDPDDASTYTVEITATIATPQYVNAIISFSQIAGNANEDDYSVGEIVIPAGSTSGSAKIEINYTGDIEGSESFTLSAAADGNFNLSNAYNVTVNIQDKVNDELSVTTTWCGESKPYNKVTVDFGGIDIDVKLYSDAGVFIGYYGAGATCTETGTLTGLADGDYFLVFDLFANPFSGIGSTETVPVTFTYSQDYFGTEGSFTYTGITLADSPDEYLAATISVSGYNYTITAE